MTPRTLLRTVRRDDLESIVRIEEACFGPGSRFPPAAFVEMMLNGGISGIVAEVDGAIVGFAFQLLNGPDSSSLLLTVDVHPDHQGRGIGRALVRHSLSVAKGLGAKRTVLQVAVENACAIGLYESLGFRKISLCKEFYGPRKDAWEMELKL